MDIPSQSAMREVDDKDCSASSLLADRHRAEDINQRRPRGRASPFRLCGDDQKLYSLQIDVKNDISFPKGGKEAERERGILLALVRPDQFLPILISPV